jgi:hypothetical protein
MPNYRVHRLRDSQRPQFRWAPHTSGVTVVKPKDYSAEASIDAASVYAAWQALRQTESPLGVGDILETEDGQLRIFKYVGFEEARWLVPEEVPGQGDAPASMPAEVNEVN